MGAVFSERWEMENEMVKIIQGFLAASRDRLNQMIDSLDKLTTGQADDEAFRKLRLGFFWFACWAKVYGFQEVSRLGKIGDKEMTQNNIVGIGLESRFLSRLRSYANAISGEIANAESKSNIELGKSRFILFTKRGERFSTREEGHIWFDSVSTDILDSVEKVSARLAEGNCPAVGLDLAGPMNELLEVVRIVKSLGGITSPIPPIIGIAENVGVLDRFLLSQKGVNAIIPINSSNSDFGRLVQKCLRETEMPRGVVFFLGLDTEVRDKLVKDLGVEGIRVYTFVELSHLLKTWLEVQPDLFLINAMRWGAGALRVIKDIKDDPHANRVPLVVITDKTDNETRQSFFETGADDYLIYPYLPKELCARVRDRIDLKHLLMEKSEGNDKPYDSI